MPQSIIMSISLASINHGQGSAITYPSISSAFDLNFPSAGGNDGTNQLSSEITNHLQCRALPHQTV